MLSRFGFSIILILLLSPCGNDVKAQTQSGAFTVGTGFTFERKDTNSDRFDGTGANLNVGASYNITNRVYFSAGGSFVRQFDATDNIYGIRAGLGYLFNMHPAEQKMIPRLGAWANGRFAGDATNMLVGGLLGFRYYFNRSIGMSNYFYYVKSFSDDSRHLRYYSFGISNGFFVQFGSD